MTEEELIETRHQGIIDRRTQDLMIRLGIISTDKQKYSIIYDNLCVVDACARRDIASIVEIVLNDKEIRDAFIWKYGWAEKLYLTIKQGREPAA